MVFYHFTLLTKLIVILYIILCVLQNCNGTESKCKILFSQGNQNLFVIEASKYTVMSVIQ